MLLLLLPLLWPVGTYPPYYHERHLARLSLFFFIHIKPYKVVEREREKNACKILITRRLGRTRTKENNHRILVITPK